MGERRRFFCPLRVAPSGDFGVGEALLFFGCHGGLCRSCVAFNLQGAVGGYKSWERDGSKARGSLVAPGNAPGALSDDNEKRKQQQTFVARSSWQGVTSQTGGGGSRLSARRWGC